MISAPDGFDASFSLKTGLDDSQDSQYSLGQSNFVSSPMASASTIPDFNASFDLDIPAWNGAVFGEFPSQESTPSSSLWEFTAKEEPSVEMGTDVDMQPQSPSMKVDLSRGGTGVSTEDELLRAIMEVVQPSPKPVSVIFVVLS